MKNLFSAVHEKLNDPEFTTSFHKYATIAWVILMVPSIFWWSESVRWIVLMSAWANVAGHWSSYQASRVEKKQDGRETGPLQS